MRRKKMLPLAVLAVSAMFFTGNSLMASAVKLEDLSDPEPWVSTPLSHAEANALWKSSVEDAISSEKISIPIPQGVPGILSDERDEDGDPWYFAEGLVENLVARYLRCSKLEKWFQDTKLQTYQVQDLATEDLTVFSSYKGVRGVMDLDEYINVISKASDFERLLPAEYEHKYFCDVLELE